MKVIRLLGRVMIAIFMIPVVFQLALSILGFIALFQGKGNGASSGYMLGRIVGSLLILMVLRWIFRALGDDRSE